MVKVSHRPVIAEARVRSRSVHLETVVNKQALKQVFLLVLPFSHVNIIPLWLSMLIHHLGDEQ
jgi:hypothetical protein